MWLSFQGRLFGEKKMKEEESNPEYVEAVWSILSVILASTIVILALILCVCFKKTKRYVQTWGLLSVIHYLNYCGVINDLILGAMMQKNIRMVTFLVRQDIQALLILNLKRMVSKGLELQVTEDYLTYQILFSMDLKTLLLATAV